MSDHKIEPAYRPDAETVPPSSWREVRRTLWATFALVVIANLAVLLLFRTSTTNVGYLLIEQKWRMLLGLERPVEWLILGDSSCNQGVDTELLERRLGGRTLNLCTIADMAVANDAWMLDAYIERVGPPPNLILVHTYDMWSRSANRALISRIPLEWAFWNRVQPPVRMSTNETVHAALERYVPLVSQNASLAKWLQTPWVAHRIVTLAKLTPSGYMRVDAADVRAVRTDMARHMTDAKSRVELMSPENARAFEHIMSRVREHGIRAYLANSPIVDELLAEPEFRRHYESVVGVIETTIGSSPMSYVMMNPLTLPAKQMQNVDHVTQEGALLFTNRLADEILAARQARESLASR